MSGPIRFDLSSINSGFEVQDPGDYPGTIIAAKRDVTGENSKNPGTPKVVYQTRLDDGRGSVFDHANVQVNMLWKHKMYWKAAGLPDEDINNPDATEDDLYELAARTLNTRVIVTLGVRKGTNGFGDQNDVKRVVSESEALVGAGSGSGW